MFHAWLQSFVFFALSFCLATLAMLPLAFVGGLLVTWSLVTLIGGVVSGMSAHGALTLVCIFCLPLWTMFAFLDARAAPRHLSSRFLLLLFTLNMGSLHEWFLTNKRVARSRATRAARVVEERVQAMAAPRWLKSYVDARMGQATEMAANA